MAEPYFAVDRTNIALARNEVAARINEHKHLNWFALVDFAFDHGRKPMKWPGPRWPLYCHGPLENLLAVSPSLLSLNAAEPNDLAAQVAHLLVLCDARPMLSFVGSPLGGQEVREHWQAFLRPQTSDGMELLLRFADTRIVSKLNRALSGANWASFTAPVAQWLVIDRAGDVLSLDINKADTTSPLPSPWQLQDDEFAALVTQGQPDAVINALAEQFEQDLPKHWRAQFYRQISDACDLAARAQLDGFPDQVALAAGVMFSRGELLNAAGFEDWLMQKNWGYGEFPNVLSPWLPEVDA